MRLSEYGTLMEEYIYHIESGTVEDVNFNEYKNNHPVYSIDLKKLQSKTGNSYGYARKDIKFDPLNSVPTVKESIQMGISLAPTEIIGTDNKGITRYEYSSAPEECRTADSFFINLPNSGVLVRKIEVDRNSVAFFHHDLSIIHIYRKSEDGEINFEDEHDTIYIYPQLMVSDNYTEGRYHRIVLRCGEKEEYHMCKSLLPIQKGSCDIVITKDAIYQVKYNFIGMVTSVTESAMESQLLSRYEMIDDQIHIAHSIYPYLVGDRPLLHTFQFRDIWVHDEATIENGEVKYLTRSLFLINKEQELVSQLRSNLNEPIINSEE